MIQAKKAPVAVMPAAIPAGVPPGLEYLLPTNQIIVKEVQPGFFSISSPKQYDIFDALGRRIYYAIETNHQGCCSDNGEYRNWNIDILNSMGQPVISGIRHAGGICENNQILVTSRPSGMTLGGVFETPGFIKTSWNIMDGSGAPVLFLDAPVFSGGLFETDYPIYTLTEPRQQLGVITKKFTGLFSMEDVFGVQLPVNLDVKLKAVLIYATFLIDFQFYEKHNHNH